MPNYLRTKLSMELEAKQREQWKAATGKDGGPTIDKVKEFNQMLSSVLERVNELKEEVEERRTKTGMLVCFKKKARQYCICDSRIGAEYLD